MHHRRTRYLASAFAALLLLTGCTSQGGSATETPQNTTATGHLAQDPPGTATPHFTPIADALDDYSREAARLQAMVPAGQSLPRATEMQWDENATYEQGYGNAVAALMVQCALLTDLRIKLQDAGTPETSESLDALYRWSQLDVVSAHFDEQSLHYLDEAINRARAGSLDELLSIASSC
jgi:hypothetical protein